MTREEATTKVLYVCDIDPLVAEPHVEAEFGNLRSAPAIRSIRVPLDQMRQRNMGHAYVNFETAEDAAEALREIGGRVFVNQALCRVVPFPGKAAFVRPPKIEGHGIFIKNLDPQTTAPELYSYFSQYGEILTCRIALNELGIPRGFAYVTYRDEESSERAITSMNGQPFGESRRKLFVGQNLPRQERLAKLSAEENNENPSNLFVKGISPQTLESTFYELFAQFGQLESYSMPLNELGVARGFGFVKYHDAAAAQRAIDELNGAEVDGRRLRVARAHRNSHQSSQEEDESTNLYIRDFDSQITDEQLAREFRRFGKVVSARVMLDSRGNSKGFGFVCFEKPEDADTAIAEMHNKNIWGSTLYVARAQRRDRSRWRPTQPGSMVPPQMWYMAMPPYGYTTAAASTPWAYPTTVPGASAFSQNASPAPVTQQPLPTLAAAVASAQDPAAEKQVIGEALYPRVMLHPKVGDTERASHVTGLLLQKANDELMRWIDDEPVLELRISQACDAYDDWISQRH